MTYTVTSTSAVSASGTAPAGSSASYSSTYNTKCQLTAGNSMTLTLSGYKGYKITGITLSMKSNTSKGAGELSATVGETNIAGISNASFNSDSWYGAWSTSYVDIDVSLDDDSYEIQDGEDVVITIAASQNSLYCQSFTLTYEAAGSPSLTDSDLALTGAPKALNFDLYNNASAQVINYTTSSTGAVTIAESEYATFDIDEENKTITVTPKAVTPSTQTITVNQAADATYNAGSVTFTLTVTDSTPIPTYTVTFSVNGATTTQELVEGAAIEFPDNPTDVSGKTFVGWVTEAIDGTTNDAPDFVTSANMGQSDVTYYAVFAYASGSGSSTIVDKLTPAFIGVSTYSNWSGRTGESGAIYAGNTTGSSESKIQMRAKDNSGIVTTTSGGKVKKVAISWFTNNELRTLNIYGKNTAYKDASDLYDSSKQGTLLGGIKTSDNVLELTINDDYEFIAFRSESNALYLSEINITWSTGGGTSYTDYCTTVADVAVARPTIDVEANPFLFSTTATIACDTEGAAIKYSYDGENWNDYSKALTITETTTLYAKAVKDEDESEVASVVITKNLATPTVAIDATGITNTNVFDGTEAGSLAATVTYNEEAVEGAVVTWSGNNDEVATIDAETGAVTLVAAGTVTFTATYAGNSDYAEKTATYEMTVTNTDPNAPGTENNPYTVAQARAAIDAGEGVTDVYVAGIVSQVDSYNSKYSSITYWISEDGTTTDQFEVYSGKGIGGANFSSKDDIQVGDRVVVKGNITLYNSSIYEFSQNNQLVSLVRKVATPTFSPVAGAVAKGTEVTISTSTEDATIYYTVDGTEPTTESTEYTEAITINEAMTIKAIAVKDGMPNSDVATAAYTIAAPCATPTFSPAAGTYNKVQNVEISTTTEGATIYYTTDGAEPTTESTEYTGAIEVDKNMTIKAIAVKDGMANSAVAEAAYEINLPDYAELPFEWDNKVAPTGVTTSGTGTYNSSPYIKFADTIAFMVLKINEAPGSLFFDIKGNSFSEGTFTVQTSADGVDYTNLKAYTDLGATQTEKFNLNADVRYIKWVYTKKVNGNVALGNIKVSADAAITIGAAKYATFSNNRATDFSETDITVYTAKVNGNYVTLTKVEDGIVPANTGVVLFSETADTYEVPFTTTENTLDDNDLLVSDGKVKGDGSTIFALANKSQGVGFYRVKDEVAVPADTPYLTIEAAAREFFGFGSETTSINGALSIKNGASVDAPVYNLNGQRILKPAKGLYIVNGKKAVIK